MSGHLINDKKEEGIEHIVMHVDYKGNLKKIDKYSLNIEENKNKTINFSTSKYQNQFIYIGEWKNDMREGKGVYYNPFTKEKYEGEFKNGKANGKGTLYYDNGDIFKGEFKNWIKEGKGIYYYHNGERVEAQFKNNFPDKGKYFYKNGIIFEGQFKNGLPDKTGNISIKKMNKHTLIS